MAIALTRSFMMRPPLRMQSGLMVVSLTFLLSAAYIALAAGYQAQDVEVITEDGHSLWMHRIGNSTGPPVIMQHGLLVAGESWILRGPDKDLAFMLLKAGFDVWLTNQRGTVYNQYNLKYNRKDPRFWDFSFHEAGYYDLPAFIDKVLKIRKKKQLFYIGHSQGTVVFFVMASTRPEYNAKIQGAVLLSPISYAPTTDEYSVNPLLRYAVLNADAIYQGFLNSRVYELLPRTLSNIKNIPQVCDNESASQDLCFDLLGLYMGDHRSNIDKKRFGYYMAFAPAGTSSKNMMHFAQVYRTGEFKQFDYGVKGNMIKYKNSTTPSYPIERITAPAALYWSLNDPLLSKSSVEKVASKLPNLLKLELMSDPKFSHLDMIIGENAKDVLYPDVISTLQSLMPETLS